MSAATLVALLVFCESAAAQVIVRPRTGPRTGSTQSAGSSLPSDSAYTAGALNSSRLNIGDIRERGISRLTDALRLLPGVIVVEQGSPGSRVDVYMRGAERQSMLVTFDGVPLNAPGGEIDIANISIDNIESITVTRGPLGGQSGDGALVGVVEISSRTARGESGINARTFMGSNRLSASDVSIGTSGPSGTFSMGFQSYRTDGIYEVNDRYSLGGYSGRAHLFTGARSTLTAALRYSSAFSRNPTKNYGQPLDPNSRGGEARLTGMATFVIGLLDSLEGEVKLSYMNASSDFSDARDSFTPQPIYWESRARRQGAGVALNYGGISVADIKVGFDYEIRGARWIDREVPNSRLENVSWNRSIYVNAASPTPRQLDYSASLRVDDNQRFGQMVSWGGAAGVPVLPATRLVASVGAGFRSAGLEEFTGGPDGRQNTGLLPERTTGWEVGVEQSLTGNRGAFRLSHFSQRIDRLITVYSIDDGQPRPHSYQNSGSRDVQGWEVTARLDPAWDVSLNASAFSLGAAGGKSLLPLYQPSHGAAIGAMLEPARSIRLGFDLNYVGERTGLRTSPDGSTAREQLGGYARLDSYAGVLIPPWFLSQLPMDLLLRVDNTLNRRYEAVPGFRTPSRRFTLVVALNLGG